MNSMSLVAGLLPLILFVLLDTFAGMKAGLIGAVLLALGEATWTWVSFGELDGVTGASVLLVVLMAWASIHTKSEKFFLFQPVVMSVLLSGYLLGSHFLGYPLFLEMAEKYKDLMPEAFALQLQNPLFRNQLVALGWTTGIALLGHATATAFAALKLNKWWWLAIRGVGFYFFLFLAAIAARWV